MPDQEFEKRIQEKMGELKLRPTAPVWERVEQGLNKKDKRRRGLLWLPFFVAMLTGIYFLGDRMHFHNEVESNNESPVTPVNSGLVEKNTSEEINKKTFRQQEAEKKNPISSGDLLEINGIDSNMTTTIGVRKSTISLQNTPGQEENNVVQTSKRGRGISNNLIIQRTTNKSKELNVITAAEINEIQVDNGNISNPPSHIADELTKKLLPSIIKQVKIPVGEIDIFRKAAPPLAKPTEKRTAAIKKRRTEFGITFRGGRSHINNGKFGNLFENKSLSSRINTAANPNATPPSPSGIVYIPPSALKPGFAYSVGGYIRRQATKAINISIGLNYKFYSSSNKTGSGKDSIFPTMQMNGAMADMRTTVYRTGATNNYINRFHFIDIPITAEGRLVNGRLPLFWNAGCSYSRLIATNALHYNRDYLLYYKDNNLFIKNQVNLSAGLNAKLFSKTSNPLYLGPELSFGLTDLLKGRDNDARHFLFIGLEVSMPINN